MHWQTGRRSTRWAPWWTKSLVQVAGPGSTTRCVTACSSTRLFALAQLRSAGELEACQREHAAAMVDPRPWSGTSRHGPRATPIGLADVEPELDNLHAALQSAIDRRDVEGGGALSEVGNWATLTTCGAGLRRWAEPIEVLPGCRRPGPCRCCCSWERPTANIAPAKALVLFEGPRRLRRGVTG